MATRDIESLEETAKRNLALRIAVYAVAGTILTALVGTPFGIAVALIAVADTASTLYLLRRYRKLREESRRRAQTATLPLV